MHFLMIGLGLVVTLGLRRYRLVFPRWQQRWQAALVQFLCPPLLLLMTAIAVLVMGPRGQMVYPWEGWVTYAIALLFLVGAGGVVTRLFWQGRRSLQQVRSYPTITLQGQFGHLLNHPLPYIAQVGFWEPQLVLSQGLLNCLTAEQVAAVLVHEQAHLHYRDTFWFFWLGWIRRLTAWLPNTAELWDELLLLREMRADHWAVQQVDSLLLAEALLIVVQTPLIHSELAAAFGDSPTPDRLTERMDALLDSSQIIVGHPWWLWLSCLLSLLPLAVIPFHA